jgi:c-di-GMP-related signal transduction protein
MGIAYKLFKYINSAFFARPNKISSVRQALIFLGGMEIRRFVSLIAMTRLANDKPNELIRAACIRGKLCELLGAEAHESTSPSEMFTLGMFSLIDAVIDQPMDNILRELPLSDSIERALLETRGRLAAYLELVRCYETGRWNCVARLARELNLDSRRLPDLYLQACQWSDAASKAA